MTVVVTGLFSPLNSCNTLVIMDKINTIDTKIPTVRGIVCALLLSSSAVLFADYEDGVNAAFKGEFDTAFYEFSLAAREGLDLAQYNLGILYFTGQGVEKDLELAFQWTKAAAEQGHIAAQFNLGNLYYAGDGTLSNPAKAVEMFSSAAMAGHPTAALLLAKMFAAGDHVNTDPVQAHAWASIALRNENVEAIAWRNELEQGMDSDQLSQARRLFARWQIQ